jgi:hypothetical protein
VGVAQNKEKMAIISKEFNQIGLNSNKLASFF